MFQVCLLMIFFQVLDANQWVVVDLGQTSLVCGVVTQGLGKSKALNAHVSTRMRASDRAASDFEYVSICFRQWHATCLAPHVTGC
jgi:hypothetical protein